MVPGSSLQSCLWKEKVRFKYQPVHARSKPPPLIYCVVTVSCVKIYRNR